MNAKGPEVAIRARRLIAFFAVVGLAVASAPAFGQSRAADFDDLDILLPAINDTLENARSGEPVPWYNPKTGNKGEIEILRTFFRSEEEPCREYERRTERPGGAAEIVRGTGCRTGPGFWSLEESESVTTPPPGRAEEARKAEEVKIEEAKAAPPEPKASAPKDIRAEEDKTVEPAKAPPPSKSKPVEITAHLPRPAAE
ncbi:MAG: hypothetical protein HOH66_16075 [Rhodospirillaceae bacterium]|jgi:surface antigen|nr:hypothetical protein [Rhodospirillaceae bacterium]